jgi:hypothetical protein
VHSASCEHDDHLGVPETTREQTEVPAPAGEEPERVRVASTDDV